MFLATSRQQSAGLLLLPLLLCLTTGGCLPLTGHKVSQAILRQKTTPLCRVALLPFSNQTEYPNGGTIAYRIFLNTMIKSQQTMVIPEGDIRQLFQEMHLLPGRQPTMEQLRILAARTGAQGIIRGRVRRLQRSQQGANVNPTAALSLDLLDATSGKVITTVYHIRDGNHYRKLLHFGHQSTITGVLARISEEIIDTWAQQGFFSCAH